MNFSLNNLSESCSLWNLKKLDIIIYDSINNAQDHYLVYNVDKDSKIPAILLQLWKFRGGYDHSVVNIIESDFGVNKQVSIYKPKIHSEKIIQFSSYRPKNSGLSNKEEFFFDISPKSESKNSMKSHPIPFKVVVSNFINTEIIIPSWTPVQMIPLDRIKEGSTVEVWEVGEIINIMKVLKL